MQRNWAHHPHPQVVMSILSIEEELRRLRKKIDEQDRTIQLILGRLAELEKEPQTHPDENEKEPQ